LHPIYCIVPAREESTSLSVVNLAENNVSVTVARVCKINIKQQLAGKRGIEGTGDHGICQEHILQDVPSLELWNLVP
jgi:hypothetical protein